MEDPAAERLLEGVAGNDRSALTQCRLRPPRRYSSSRLVARTRGRRRSAGPRGRAARRAPEPRPAALSRRTPTSVSTSTPRGRERSSGRPAATTRPRERMTTRSQTSSTSLSRCELSSTPISRPRSSSRSSRRSCGLRGRARSVGSSRSSARGEPTAPERCRAAVHPLRHCVELDASLGEPDELEQLTPFGPPPDDRASRWWSAEHLVGRAPAREAEGARRGSRAQRGPPAIRQALRRAPPSRGGADQAAGDLHKRRFAGTVRAQEPDQLAGLHVDTDVVERLDAP